MSKQNRKKFLDIADDLAKKIKLMAPGDKLPTATELKTGYNITITTASKVIKELQTRGLIYSKRGTGSYVSSKQQCEFVLCVQPDEMPPIAYHWLLFQTSLCLACSRDYEHYSIITVPEGKLIEEVMSLRNRSQQIGGAIFFRDKRTFLKHAEFLDDQGIIPVFYGSSTYMDELKKYNFCFYDEEKIIELAMQQLYENGHRRIGCIYDSSSVLDAYRHSLYKKFLKKHGIEYSSHLSLDTSGEHYAWFDDVTQSRTKREQYRNYLSKVTGLLVLHDYLAAVIMQEMINVGFRVPEDISIISIDNLQIAEIMRPQLDSVKLNIYENTPLCLEILEKAKSTGKNQMLESPLDVARRQSILNIKNN
jgi:DNA-binding LacI/PurR family transcriptional regulator/predicted transcriptional regulator